MPIRFLPNDPLAQDVLPMREQPPRPEPPDSHVGFGYAGAVAEDLYEPDSAAFRFWQCREAALATLEAWTALAPRPGLWQHGARLLSLRHDAGPGLGAYYDRAAVAFLGSESEVRKTYPAASTDAVAHEVGHALLDAIRPELWDSVYTETAAFHEAFADCMAILVGLFDAATRQALVQGGGPRQPNVVEALAEDVAEGVRLEHGDHDPQSLPRRALNILQWEIPVNLPPAGLPASLTAEAHSFSRVFTGCFYDIVCNIFESRPNRDEQDLLAAAQTAGRLLVDAARTAPEVARFFQAIGRTMILADDTVSGGVHHAAIRDGFAAHSIAIGSTVMLAPSAALAGRAPTVDAASGAVALSPAARHDLLERIGARDGRLRVNAHTIGGRAVARAVHRRGVDLAPVARRLKGVIVPAVESVLIGGSAARAVILGHLPDARTTLDEVHHFVGTLLEHGALVFPSARGAAKRRRAATGDLARATHVVQRRGSQAVLRRVRFSCDRHG